jgi:hypothetical protein
MTLCNEVLPHANSVSVWNDIKEVVRWFLAININVEFLTNCNY